MPIQEQLTSGTSRDFRYQIRNPDGSPAVGLFLPSDALRSTIWAGDDQAPLLQPAATWLDANNGRFQVSLLDADSASLTPGIYRLQAYATRTPPGRTTALLPRGTTLEITSAAGAGIAGPVYCTFEDMAVECNWIQQFQDTEEDQTGFLEQRVKARLWMDGLILYAAPVGQPGGLISRQQWWSWSFSGVDPRSGTGLAIDTVLKGYLDAGGLVTTGPQGARIVTATATYSIALVLRAQLGLSAQQSKFAGEMMRRAHAEASMVRAEVRIDANSIEPAYCINLGSTNTRYA